MKEIKRVKTKKSYRKIDYIKAFLLTFLIILISIPITQAAPDRFDAKTLSEIKTAMPDVMFGRMATHDQALKILAIKNIFINQSVKKIAFIKNQPRIKVLKVDNDGDAGGYFKVEITGPKNAVKTYSRDIKFYDLAILTPKTRKYDLALAERNKIIKDDEKMRADRELLEQRRAIASLEEIKEKIQRKRATVRVIEQNAIADLKREDANVRAYGGTRNFNRPMSRDVMRDRNAGIDREAISNPRFPRGMSTFNRDQQIQEVRETRRRTEAQLDLEWQQANEAYNRQFITKKSEPLYQYDPNKDVLIEISLHDSTAEKGFFIVSFDPTIKGTQRHFYRPTYTGKKYNAAVDVSTGWVRVQFVERDNVASNGRYRNVLAEKTVGIGKSIISYRSHRSIPVDLVISHYPYSNSNSAQYSGSISSWSEF